MQDCQHTLVPFSRPHIRCPDHYILLLECSDQFRVAQYISLELLIVLVFSAHNDHHANLALFSDIQHEFAVRSNIEIRQRIRACRTSRKDL